MWIPLWLSLINFLKWLIFSLARKHLDLPPDLHIFATFNVKDLFEFYPSDGEVKISSVTINSDGETHLLQERALMQGHRYIFTSYFQLFTLLSLFAF